MKSLVEVVRMADRHKATGRDFAEPFAVVVEVGPLPDMLLEVAAAFDEPLFRDLGPGRYHIVIGEPYEWP